MESSSSNSITPSKVRVYRQCCAEIVKTVAKNVAEEKVRKRHCFGLEQATKRTKYFLGMDNNTMML